MKIPKQISLGFFQAVDRLASIPVCEEKFGDKLYMIYAKGLKETVQKDITGFFSFDVDGFEIICLPCFAANARLSI